MTLHVDILFKGNLQTKNDCLQTDVYYNVNYCDVNEIIKLVTGCLKHYKMLKKSSDEQFLKPSCIWENCSALHSTYFAT
jgi:hypothetical protein